MDEDGYPTKETLETIRNWDCSDPKGLLDYVTDLWNYPEYWEWEGGKLHISTGGWSGHEEIINAMEDNVVFWLMCWEQSRRGGHYIFRKNTYGKA